MTSVQRTVRLAPMQSSTVAIMARHALFRRLSQADKAALLRLVTEEKIGANMLIFQEGSQGDSLYIVIEGAVLLQREVDGQPTPITQLAPGESFGELALLYPGTRLLTAKSIAPGLVARLSHASLQQLAEKLPKAALSVQQRIIEHFLIKVRHLEPMWAALANQGLKHLEAGHLLSSKL